MDEKEAPAALDGTNFVTSTPAVCRVCYTEGNVERGPLVASCACKGSLGLAHKGCLERWLRERDTDRCNVCLHRYAVSRKRAPLYGFFTDPDSRKEVIRMVVDVVSGSGDVMMLVFGWTYATGFMGLSSWLSYLLVFGVLLFQTVFWCIVEVVRVRTWCESVRKWRKKTTFIELLLNGEDSGARADLQVEPEVAERKASALSSTTAIKNAPLQSKTSPDSGIPPNRRTRSGVSLKEEHVR